jgi:nucleoside phosphorylase
VAFRTFRGKGGKPLRVAVAQAGGMAGVAAVNALLPLVEKYQPRCVAMCGVCAGHPEKTKLGDVITADRLFFHDTGKFFHDTGKREPGGVKQDPLGAGDVASRGGGSRVASRLRGALPSVEEGHRVAPSGWPRAARHAHPRAEPHGEGAQAHRTGIEDEKVWGFISQSMRKTLGLEMEAAAVGAVAHAQRDKKLEVVVMKGVMDFANHGRDDHFKEFAVRDDLLVSGTERLSENPPPSALLNARYEVVPFHDQGRESILAELDRWCDAGPAVAVRLLHAEGGAGKTRLAIEWIRRRQKMNWAAGFLSKKTTGDWFDRLWGLGQPVLAVLDYANTFSSPRTCGARRGVRAARRPSPAVGLKVEAHAPAVAFLHYLCCEVAGGDRTKTGR